MNAHEAAVFWQDLPTNSNDVIKWTLKHAVRPTDAGPATQNKQNNENNEGGSGNNNNSSSKEFNKTMQKKSGFEKVAETTANIIKTGVRVGEAIGTQGKSEMNKGQGGK